MHAPTDARIVRFLTDRLRVNWSDTGTILERMRTLARTGGFDLDERFAAAGLSAGPEARLAASIVMYAIGGSGSAVSEYEMKQFASRWVRTFRPKGGR